MIAGIIPGIAYDAIQRHNRFGPRLVLLVGGLIHFLGYLGLWAAASHTISQPPYWVVVGFGVVAMNGASWTDIACISANVRSFPRDRGTAIGKEGLSVLQPIVALINQTKGLCRSVCWLLSLY